MAGSSPYLGAQGAEAGRERVVPYLRMVIRQRPVEGSCQRAGPWFPRGIAMMPTPCPRAAANTARGLAGSSKNFQSRPMDSHPFLRVVTPGAAAESHCRRLGP